MTRDEWHLRKRARGMISSAVASGRLTRKPCICCGHPNSQAHHEDYAKPLEIKWLCRKCHRKADDGLNRHPKSTQIFPLPI
jgi:hypothetical protein